MIRWLFGLAPALILGACGADISGNEEASYTVADIAAGTHCMRPDKGGPQQLEFMVEAKIGPAFVRHISTKLGPLQSDGRRSIDINLAAQPDGEIEHDYRIVGTLDNESCSLLDWQLDRR